LAGLYALRLVMQLPYVTGPRRWPCGFADHLPRRWGEMMAANQRLRAGPRPT